MNRYLGRCGLRYALHTPTGDVGERGSGGGGWGRNWEWLETLYKTINNKERSATKIKTQARSDSPPSPNVRPNFIECEVFVATSKSWGFVYLSLFIFLSIYVIFKPTYPCQTFSLLLYGASKIYLCLLSCKATTTITTFVSSWMYLRLYICLYLCPDTFVCVYFNLTEYESVYEK